MTRKLLLIIVCFLFPLGANGADWVKISEVDNFYLDVSSIKKVAQDQYMAWSKAEFNNFASIKEVKIHSLHHCAERKVKELHSILYYKDGSVYDEGERDWHSVVPESNYEKILIFVCTYKKEVDI